MQSEQLHLMHEIEDSHWWFVARRRILVRLLEACLPPRADTLVVDVGCGTGGNLAVLAGRYDCLGIDASEEALRLAHNRNGRARFERGQLPNDLPAELTHASAVLLADVLEHVERDVESLATIVDWAPDGCLFLLTVPADMRLWSPHDAAHGHFRRYSQPSFASLWANLPVDTLLLSHFCTRLYPVIRAVRAINRWRGKTWGQAGTDLSLPPGPVNWLLRRIFAGEAGVLIRALQGRRKQGYARGASLVAVLRKRPVAGVAATQLDSASPREIAACTSAP
jgi:SAM-dependent methyltransferase